MSAGKKKADSPNPAPDSIEIPVWKKILFSAVAVVVFFSVLEGLLFIIGIKPVLYRDDPYVGFSSHAPLFKEQTAEDGRVYYVTADNKLTFFQEQKFPKDKPAGAYRIFCMGGSTTYGRPYGDSTSFCGWLREFLTEADPAREWEVINAGGVSYASYRVALLMEELVHYQPDLFIIYSAHNEFLERRTYDKIINIPPAVRGLGALASKTRTYAVLKSVVDKATAPPAQEEDRKNVLAGEVETILEGSVGPSAYTRDDELTQQVIQHYRYNLGRMIDIAHSAGAKVIIVEPASNLRDSSPYSSVHRDGLSADQIRDWQRLQNDADRSINAADWNQALAVLNEMLEIDSRYAETHFLKGRVLWQLGRYDEAKASFVKARDEDVCPLRALSSIEAIVKEVAADYDVPLVDFKALVEAQSEHGVPGENIFVDHVHPTIDGNRQLALALLDELFAQGVAEPVAGWGEAVIARVTEKVKAGLDPDLQGKAIKNLARIYRWAGKFEEGYRLALQALEMIPDSPEANYLAGSNALLTNRPDEAVVHLKRALELNPELEEVYLDLGNALHQLGREDEAIEAYERALRITPGSSLGHNNLGNALAAADRYEEAETQYLVAMEIDPENADIYNNLGILYFRQQKNEEAIGMFRRAIELKADYSDALCNLGIVFASQGNKAEGIRLLREAIEAQPDHVEAHYNLGLELSLQGHAEEAIRHFEKVIELEPENPEAHNSLGLELSESGETDAAIDHYKQALEYDPEYVEAHLNLCDELLGEGDVTGAVRHCRKALDLEPGIAEAHFFLGLAYRQIELTDEAIENLRKATELRPDWPAPLMELSYLLIDQNTSESINESVRLCEKAAELTEYKNPRIVATLARFHAIDGDFAQAASVAGIALKAATDSGEDELASQIRLDIEQYLMNE